MSNVVKFEKKPEKFDTTTMACGNCDARTFFFFRYHDINEMYFECAECGTLGSMADAIEVVKQ